VGSGRALLALRADWQAQLARCRRELGFRRVRFHGLLDDGPGLCVRDQGRLVRAWYNVDAIADALLAMDVRPFVELSFMPSALASGGKTVFNYAANVTPPADPAEWTDLVGALARHWIDRHGASELRDWRFEVWNEPNLEAFWTGGKRGYFDFYRQTAEALRSAGEVRVGGPVTAKSEWLPEFSAFCAREHVPVDFLSTHVYPTDALGGKGTDTRTQLAESGRDFLRTTAEKAREVAGSRPLYYTEWNVTSNPRDALHDGPYAAAYAVKALLDVDPIVDLYSWWTFSDIFEENYFPAKAFHGGFGLLTIHGVAKPAYRAFELLHRLGGDRLEVAGKHPTVEVTAVRGEGGLHLVVVNLALPDQPIATEKIAISVSGLSSLTRATVERIDEDHANPRRLWAEWGEPDQLSAAQVEALESAGRLVEEPVGWRFEDGTLEITLTVPANALAVVSVG
jgi:xylan 1,4-beta-xylosidase